MATKAAPTQEQEWHIAYRYGQGASARTIGNELGRSDSWVRAVLTQLGIPRRFKGYKAKPGYSAGHKRVVKARGKASNCVACGAEDDRAYHWANLTGNYGDPEDYQSMCVPCHHAMDRQSPPRHDRIR